MAANLPTLPLPLRDLLALPFFEPRHLAWAEEVEPWAAAHAARLTDHHDADGSTRVLARAMGDAGLLRVCSPQDGRLDVRALCLAREILARHSGQADFALAMQGLGTGPVTLFGSPELREAVLPRVRAGEWLAAFALSEPEAGSDVAALATRAERDGNAHWRITGEKTWISNGGIAASYVVFARTGEGSQGERGGARRGSRRSGCPAGRPAWRWLSASRSARHTPSPACASTAYGCPMRTASALRGKGSRSRWPRSTCSAPRSARPPSASRGGPMR